jgi:hypothetical protein
MPELSIESQQDMLKAIVKNNSGSSLYTHLEINQLAKIKDFEELYSEFKNQTPLVDNDSFITLLSHVTGVDKDPVKLLSQPKLLTKNNIEAIGKWNKECFPISKHHLKGFYELEKEIIKNVIPADIKGKNFQLFESAEVRLSKGVVVGDLQALYNQNRPWRWKRHFVPELSEFAGVGKSRYQLMHAFLDTLDRSPDIEVVFANPKTLAEMSLILAQREGRFVPLNEMCPRIKHYIHFGEPLYLHRKEVGYFLQGLGDLDYLEVYTNGTGAFAYQADFNLKHWLTLCDDLGVFYEFIPVEDTLKDGRLKKSYRRFHAGQVDKGKSYLLVVSSLSGLLSYSTGDIIEVKSTNPLRIRYCHPNIWLNHFGESLNQESIEILIAEINDALVLEEFFIRDYLVGDDVNNGRPHWVLEISRPVQGVSNSVLRVVANRLHMEMLLQNNQYRHMYKETDKEIEPPYVTFVAMGTFSSLAAEFSRSRFDTDPELSRVKKIIDGAWDKKTLQAEDSLNNDAPPIVQE